MNKPTIEEGVYGITPQPLLDQPEILFSRVRQAFDGGMRLLQLRAKGHPDQYAIGHELRQICTDFQRPFIVNDDVELALSLSQLMVFTWVLKTRSYCRPGNYADPIYHWLLLLR